LIAFVLLLFTMTGPTNAKVDLLAEMFSSYSEKSETNAYWKGRVDQQLADLRSITVKLDVDLQREMRDVNATTEAKLVALDQRLQGEIGNITTIQQGEIDQSSKDLKESIAQQIKNIENISTLWERIRSLERERDATATK
jgi:hypothetical protein